MILSNITVPLLGLVDTVVVGHLSDAYYLGAVSVGAMIITFVYSMALFLRMATTGVTAQAYGQQSPQGQLEALVHGIALALGLAVVILLLHPLIGEVGFSLAGGSSAVREYGMSYFAIRIYGAPAALINLVLLGWMLGMQSAKGPVWHLIITNCINIVFDLWFVWGLGFGVEGVAWASLIADYSGVLVGAYFVRELLRKNQITVLPESLKVWQHWQAIAPLLLINRDIFLRTLCLSVCFMFMTFKGARLGDDIIAANAILLNLLTLISFALDGVAYGVEALVGKAVGAKNREALRQSIKDSLFWGVIFALAFVLLFAVGGEWILSLLTDIDSVLATASIFLPWMILMPIISMWCYIFDGVFIGLTRAKDMRDSTFLAALFGFFLPIGLLSHGLWLVEVEGDAIWHNHVLWLAMSGFMLLRGVVLAVRLRGRGFD